MQTQSCMQHSARINYNGTTCSAGHSNAHSSDFILFLYYIYNIISTLCQIRLIPVLALSGRDWELDK